MLANGDDISAPQRVTVLVDNWLAGRKQAAIITSDLSTIDANGEPLSRIIETAHPFQTLEEGAMRRFGSNAASLALRRDVFNEFGPLQDNLILEDGPLCCRGTLLGKRIHLTDATLVHYRIHENNISQSYAHADFCVWRQRQRKALIWQSGEAVKAYLQILRDLHGKPAERWEQADLKRARWVAMEKLIENAMKNNYYLRDDTISSQQWWAFLLRLSVLILKLTLKRWFPIFQYRSDFWHYTQVKKN